MSSKYTPGSSNNNYNTPRHNLPTRSVYLWTL